MSTIAETFDELAAVRAALAEAWARQGDQVEVEKHRAASRFFTRAAAEQRLAEAGHAAQELAA